MKKLILSIIIFYSTLLTADQKVGVILPLTGDFGYFGQDFKLGFNIAIEELRSEGHKIPEIIFEDDQCLGKSAVTAFNKLTEFSKVSFVIGPACSASIKSISPIAIKKNLPMLILLDSGSFITELPDPLYALGFNPGKMAEKLADDILKENHGRIAVIKEDEEYAILIAESFSNYVKSHNAEIIYNESIPVNSKDLQSIITKLLSKKPDVIFYSSAYQAGTFLKKLRTLDKDIPVYGNDTMCVADTIEVAKESAENATCGNVILEEAMPKVIKFSENLTKILGKTPKSLFYPALGYDSAYLMMRELGVDVNMKLLLGVSSRNQSGVYDIPVDVLKIMNGKITKK